MPETDAQKKELEQAEETQQVTTQNDGAGNAGDDASADAQKKEIHEN